ncbi:MAG: hypothetical protein RLZZ501_851 [Pseudomonadota bacterium]|jgi:phage virion morphogenesis protein
MVLIRAEIDDQATRSLAALAERLGKARGLMDAIGQHLVSSALRRFQTQTGPDGTPWAPLAKATLRKRGPNAKALQASGRLRLSLTFLSTVRSVEVGSNLIYAALMQMGGTVEQSARSMPIFRRQQDLAEGRSRFVKESRSDFKTYHEVKAHSVTVPGRPYIGIGPADQRAIARLAHDYVMGATS